MMQIQLEPRRREILQSAAALAVASLESGFVSSAIAATPAGTITGKGPGDFDFLIGEWTIEHKRFDGIYKNDPRDRVGSATVRRVLNGMGSIEELRGPGGAFRGMGVRVWHPAENLWADHWTAYEDGVVNPPQLGQFIDGAGVFHADDEMDGKPVKVRAVWDQITPASCRWYQKMSKDGGKTWEGGWYMAWTRVA